MCLCVLVSPVSILHCIRFKDRFTPHLICDPDASKKHLTLDQLGRALQILNERSVSKYHGR